MGRKKSQRKLLKKRVNNKLETSFDCPKCNNERVVSCKMFRSQKKGLIFCKVCKSSYECDTNALTQPIDIYHKWLD